MKAKVLMPFVDKNTKKVVNVGAVIECDSKRFAEIRKAGHYVEEVKEEAKPKAEQE